ncbi:Gp19/Gp15/Gp42 family protein [Saccharomonospora viridis]|uniref:Gp19/Gp15/Gp42 family protein n=1 Tax=Saccharomonospora viridis TaxID=1852 RepID=UPI00240A7643|nr:Gp19/Gp15/Gp42 family protein [Saccharomonospora viridis]
MAVATLDDVKARIGRPLTPTEATQVQAWLDDIEAEIRHRITDFDERIADDAYRSMVVRVESAAVIRVLRNPDGKLTERIDDYSWTRDSSTASGQLGLLPEEWALLSPTVSTGAWTVRPAGATSALAPDPWEPL